ncbi:MAG TPA: response regulator [Terriglobales bacterium]|nr:response regulator [Terriglobales bacterium]
MLNAELSRISSAEHCTLVLPKGRILLVEDEQFLRTVIQRVLCDQGYEVITAKDAAAALRGFRQVQGNVDLLITDVILPGRNGAWLAAKLMRKRPGLKTVLISGYPEGIARSRQRSAIASIYYLPKPFTTEVLTEKVREVLCG